MRDMRPKRLNTQLETAQLRFQSHDLNPSLPDLLSHMAYVLQHLLETASQETGPCLFCTELQTGYLRILSMLNIGKFKDK